MTRAHGISPPRRAICGVCGEPTNKPTRMCKECSESYERYARRDGSIAEIIGWAARRARWYEQRRKRARGRSGRPKRSGTAIKFPRRVERLIKRHVKLQEPTSSIYAGDDGHVPHDGYMVCGCALSKEIQQAIRELS